MSELEPSFIPPEALAPQDLPETSVLNRADSDYQLDLIIKVSEIEDADIQSALDRPDIDAEEQEYWLGKFQHDFNDQNVAEKLRFFALVSKMTEEEKIALYVFAKRFSHIPSLHDVRSHFTSYFVLFPQDKAWVAKANEQLN